MSIATTYPEMNGEIVGILRQSTDPVRLCAARYIEDLRALLVKALDCVDADEQARYESWPQEVERGELILDLGDRIREALDLAR
jgi:hypothetical protein